MKRRMIKMNISSRKYIMNFYFLLMKGKSVDPLGSLQQYQRHNLEVNQCSLKSTKQPPQNPKTPKPQNPKTPQN